MLSPAAQVRLLQVVEERVYQPVGSSEFQPLKARLIVASNRPLQQQVDEGKFRSDLFYRLNVMAFKLPPLRERREEVLPLADGFVGEFANMHGFDKADISTMAGVALRSYDWPGNVRELRNVIERSVILSAGETIELTHLSAQVADCIHTKVSSEPLARATAEKVVGKNKLATARLVAERRQLLDALERNDNNRSKTAIDLGISRVALYKRLRKLHIL